MNERNSPQNAREINKVEEEQASLWTERMNETSNKKKSN